MIRSSGIEHDHEQPSLDSSEALERLGDLVFIFTAGQIDEEPIAAKRSVLDRPHGADNRIDLERRQEPFRLTGQLRWRKHLQIHWIILAEAQLCVKAHICVFGTGGVIARNGTTLPDALLTRNAEVAPHSYT